MNKSEKTPSEKKRWIDAIGSALRNYGASLLLLILLLALWEFGSGESMAKIMPRPSVIVSKIFEIWPVLWKNLKQTALEALIGFLFGTGLGSGIAIGFIYSRNVARTVYPYAVLLRSLPLLALMPLLVSWFGPGLTSKTIIISLATFFPTLVNMVQGLSSVDKNTLELMDTYNAPEKVVFWKVRLPFSLPYLFTSIKITLPGAVLAAIISEWLWASKGLGAYIVNTMFNAKVNNLWAAMTLATLLSILVYLLAALLETLLIPWHASVKDRQGGGS